MLDKANPFRGPRKFYRQFSVKTLFKFPVNIHVTEVDVREVKLGRLSSLEFPFLEQDH